jgi:hypothetical protein
MIEKFGPSYIVLIEANIIGCSKVHNANGI